ncbi:MAG: hypothetical protein ACR2GN_01915 [Bacteroidia bacterium]
MKESFRLSEKISVYGLIISLSIIVFFHLFVLTGVIPFEMVWGGRLNNREEMIQFEIISIVINIIMLLVVLARAGIIGAGIKQGIIRVALWLMFILFLLNTVGNIFSDNELEKLIFTPVTIILAVFSFILALNPSHQNYVR